MSFPKCCGMDTRWVENVAGKGYFYCGECKTEAFDPASVVLEEAPKEEMVYVTQTFHHALRGLSARLPTLRPIQPFLDAIDDTGEEKPKGLNYGFALRLTENKIYQAYLDALCYGEGRILLAMEEESDE